MSSPTALYRRYRPDTFQDVIGQEHVTEPLMTALRKDRVNHAYLFSGPRGCGKTTSARILARCLNCEKGPTPEPCGVCPSCVELARGGAGSLDVIEIDAASHGGVDDARDLRERATFAPVRDRYKIFIIDEAHMVTSAGFNALLKIVEEPPEHIKFIFATTEPDKVIGTIRSRTHHYPFRLVPPEPLMAYLEQLCSAEHMPVEPGVLSLVVRAGGGSVRDSLSVLDQLMAGAGAGGIDYELAVALLGYTHAALLDDVVDAVAAADSGTVFRAVDRVVQTGHDPRRFVEDLLERFRDLIIVRALPDAAESILRGVPADQLARMRTQAQAIGASELSRAADVTNAAFNEMTGATSPRLHLELLCARLMLPAADGDHGLAARLDRLERRMAFGEPEGASAGTAHNAPRVPGASVPNAPGPAPSAPVASTGQAAPSAPVASTGPAASSAPEASTGPAASSAPAERAPASGTAESERASSQQPEPAATVRAPQAEPALTHQAPQPEPAATVQAAESAQASRGRSGESEATASDSDSPAEPAAREETTPTDEAPAASSTAPAAAATRPAAESGAPAPPAHVGGNSGGAGSVEMFRRAWPEILEALASIKRLTWILVSQNANVAGFDGRTLTLAFANSGSAGSFSRGDHSDNVRRAIQKVLGTDVQIDATTGGNGPSAAAARGAESGPKAPAEPDQRSVVPEKKGDARPAASSASSSPARDEPIAAQDAPLEKPAPSAADIAWGLASAPEPSSPTQSAPQTPNAPSARPSSAATRPSSEAAEAGPAQSGPEAYGSAQSGPAQSGPAQSWPAGAPPATAGPTAQQTSASQPTPQQPAASQPTPQQPAASQPTPQQPAASQPTPQHPAVPRPTPSTPVTTDRTPESPASSGPSDPYGDIPYGDDEPPADWDEPLPEDEGPRRRSPDRGPRSGQHGAPTSPPPSPSPGAGAPSSRPATPAAGAPSSRPAAADDPWSFASESAPGVWAVGTEPNTNSSPTPGASAEVPPAPAASSPSYAPAAAQPPTRPEPVSPSPAANGARPLSMYQRLSQRAAQERDPGQPMSAHAPAPVRPMVEDIPSADDETIEASGLFGRAAVERILGGKLVEERGHDGTVIPPR